MRIKKQRQLTRGAGVLLPLASLPSAQGIGSFDEAAYSFIDFLRDAGQSYWQVLPLVPVGYGNSPYQSCSAFAGGHIYIDMYELANEGLIDKSSIEGCCWGKIENRVDYKVVSEKKNKLLKLAYEKCCSRSSDEYDLFCAENSYWLESYSVFMAAKEYFTDKPWYEWDDTVKFRNTDAINKLREKLKHEIDFHKFCQYKFYQQWNRLKKYAVDNGILIIGDIPIYVALDSSDVWAAPEQFQLDKNLLPILSAGVPPDMFSKTGQLWGNPIYDWNVMEHQDFEWWKNRMRHTAALYDLIRIDHFIGIVHYYAVPYGDSTAENGKWINGPGEKLLSALSHVTGGKKIIAEDLGAVTKSVRNVMHKCGYPGMKLMEFAFDGNPLNENLPHMFEKNCIVYGGTHDNETLAGYFSHQKSKTLKFTKSYLNIRKTGDIPWAIIRNAYSSSADIAIFQLQDYLELDNKARINIPSTVGENWCWRLTRDQLTSVLAEKMKKITVLYGRQGVLYE